MRKGRARAWGKQRLARHRKGKQGQEGGWPLGAACAGVYNSFTLLVPQFTESFLVKWATVWYTEQAGSPQRWSVQIRLNMAALDADGRGEERMMRSFDEAWHSLQCRVVRRGGSGKWALGSR